jgi:trigger factor
VSVSEVAAPRLPELDAEFAKSLGVAEGDVQKMREEVRANVEREVKNRLKAGLKDQVMQALLDSTAVDVPKALVEGEAARLQELMRQDFAARGMPVKEDMALPTELFEKQALRRVTLGLILAEVVKTHQLQAKPEQVKAIVEELAQSYEHPQEVVRFYYQSPERLREIESMVLEDNVVEWALKSAQVADKPVDFDELMGNRR